MSHRYTASDMTRLAEDIRSEADKYDLCCTIVLSDENSAQRMDFNGADKDDAYVLDCAGGFLLGLSVLMLNDAGELDLAAPLTDYIPAGELPKDAADECALSLLCRSVHLPDPLHGILLPRLYRSAEFAALDWKEMTGREQGELLAHRNLAAQTALLGENEESNTTGLAPSPLVEAILAELVRRVSGLSPADFVRCRILEPLDIKEPERTHDRQNSGDIVCLPVSGLAALMRGIIDGRLLDETSFNLAADTARGGHTLPFGRRQEILCARSAFCGCTVEVLLDVRSGVSVLAASHSPLPEIRRGDSFVRLDVDIARLMNARTVYPSKTRMERLSGKNLADALTVETDGEHADFVSTPAAAIADASFGSGEIFVIREGRTAAGLLTFAKGSLPGTTLLDTLIIDRRYQRRGFGKIAVKWAMSYQRRQGAQRLMVCVDRRNTAARALYDSLGFEISEVHGHALILMYELN